MRLSRKFPVPGDLALLYEFVNSRDLRRFVQDGVRHRASDELATATQLEAWLQRRGLLKRGAKIDRHGHRQAIELRESLRAFLQLAPSERRRSAPSAVRLSANAANFPLVVQVSTDGTVRLQPQPARPHGTLGNILAELQHAADTGKLDRLKTCASEECRWVFYDRSKPGSRRWCSSALCGNRQKVRAYRRRQQAASPAGSR